MSVLVTCKHVEDPFKNEGARVVTTVFPFGRVTIRAQKWGSGSPGATKRVIYQNVRYNL